MAIATKGIHRVPLRKRRRSRPVAIYLHLCGLTAPLGFCILVVAKALPRLGIDGQGGHPPRLDVDELAMVREPSITEQLPQQVASCIRHCVVDEQRLFLQRLSQTAAWRFVCRIQRPVDDVRIEIGDMRQAMFPLELLTEDLA